MSTDSSGQSDAELIGRVRDGDVAAFAVLYERHRGAATAFARRLSSSEADDLVAEGFVLVFGQLRRGAGPDAALLPYLRTTIRHLQLRRSRREGKVVLPGDEDALDQAVESEDAVVAAFDRSAAVEAFRSLPERWQTVLWLVDVERRAASEVAPEFGLTSNAVSALAVRAREGLRQAYLRRHVALDDDVCRGIADDLPSYVRGTASRRTVERVEAHLPTCADCTAAYAELTEVNSRLGVLLLPALVLSGYAVPLSGTLAPSIVGPVLLGAGRLRDALRAHLGGVKAAVVVASVGGIGGAVVLAALISPRSAEQSVSWEPPRSVATSGTTSGRPTPTASTAPTARPTSVPPRRPTTASSVTVGPPTVDPPTVHPPAGARPARQTSPPATPSGPRTAPTQRPPTPGARATERPGPIARPTPAVRSATVSVTQRGKSPHYDVALVVRTAPGVSAVRALIRLPAGAVPTGRQARGCRAETSDVVCQLATDRSRTTAVTVAMRYVRHSSATVAGTVDALAGGRVVDSSSFSGGGPAAG